jgi:hypothetical protein
MKINKSDLASIVKKVIEESHGVKVKEEYDTCLSEDTFEINPEDSDMQQKIQKIKGDTTLFNPEEDEIKISESYKKSEVLKLMAEAKKKKEKSNSDYIKAIKKADRELEYDLTGPGWNAKDKAHKNKSKYDRKKDKKEFLNDNVNESVLSKSDIVNMILEKKYNAKIYSKSELMSEINKK